MNSAGRGSVNNVGVAAPSTKQRIAADVMPATIPDGVITPSDVAWILQNCAGVK
jgi:hypothetical protein